MTDRTRAVQAPAALEIRVGGLAGARRVVLERDGQVRDEERDFVSDSTSSRLVVPDEDAWAKLRAGLEALEANGWEADYQPQVPITDGSGWSAVIVYADGYSVRSEGYEAFPPGGPLDESNDCFDAFCAIMSDLIGAPFGTREEHS